MRKKIKYACCKKPLHGKKKYTSFPAMTVRSQDPSSRSIHVRPGICAPLRVRGAERGGVTPQRTYVTTFATCSLSVALCAQWDHGQSLPLLHQMARRSAALPDWTPVRFLTSLAGWWGGSLLSMDVMEPYQKLVKY